MATINTAQNFGVDRDLRCLAPGRYADVVPVEDLGDFAAGAVIARREAATEEGKLLIATFRRGNTRRVSAARVRLPRPLAAGDSQ